MGQSLASASALSPRLRHEIARPAQAKVDRLPDENRHERRPKVGAALLRALMVTGWSLKEASAELGLDGAQLSRWTSGRETVQIHRIYGTRLYGPFVIELARECDECVVRTTVSFERRVGERRTA